MITGQTVDLIARRLEQLGFDHEIARIFTIDAALRGRLPMGLTVEECMHLVMDFMTPIGVFYETEPRDRCRHAGRPPSVPTARSTSGSWIIA